MKMTRLASSAILGCLAVTLTGCLGQEDPRRGGPTAAYSGPMIEMAGPNAPRLVGRFDSVPHGVRFAWSGSALTAHFRGTALSVDLTDSGQNQFMVLVDGKPLREKISPPAGRNTVELIRGLPRAEHTVTLYKLTEPLVGDTTVHAFVMDQYGEALPTLAPAPRRIEVIGDSISAGYGNEGAGPNCPFSAETENHFLSYAARAARALNADLTTLAWSGRGVFTNRGSTTETETMSVLWKRVLPSEGGSSWGFPAPPPDAVIINLGTNDFAPEVKDETPFRAAYDALLSDVRQHYPDAQLFAAVGPLLSDAYPEGRHALTTVRTTLRELVGARTSGGDAKLHYLEFEPVLADEGYGCDFHPSVKTHTRMAAELVSALSTTLGWK